MSVSVKQIRARFWMPWRVDLDTPRSVVIQWWRDGDWQRLAPYVLRCARIAALQVCADLTIADDAATIALTRIYASAVVPETPRAWIKRVAQNVCRDILKRRAVEQRLFTDLHDEIAETSNPNYRATLLESIERIPSPAHRNFLRLWLDHERDELAQLLNVSPEAVSMRFTRAHRALARVLTSDPRDN